MSKQTKQVVFQSIPSILKSQISEGIVYTVDTRRPAIHLPKRSIWINVKWFLIPHEEYVPKPTNRKNAKKSTPKKKRAQRKRPKNKPS